MKTNNVISVLKSYRVIIWLCIPPYIGWIGFFLARSWPSWDDNPWSSWPIFVLLMAGWCSLLPVVIALFLAILNFFKRAIPFYHRVFILAVVLCSLSIMMAFYGLLARSGM